MFYFGGKYESIAVFVSETQKKPNFQPEIREHQLSSRLIWNKGEIWALPIIKQLFFLSH